MKQDRADRKAAQLYEAQEMAKGAKGIGKSGARSSGATLAELGTTKQEMAKAGRPPENAPADRGDFMGESTH